jgi:hypothetical protein
MTRAIVQFILELTALLIFYSVVRAVIEIPTLWSLDWWVFVSAVGFLATFYNILGKWRQANDHADRVSKSQP